MSLFSSLQLGSNSLRCEQIAMQVVGQNIANASTPGYIREQAVLTPAPSQTIGGITLGLGVQVEAVVQKIDKFLEERLRTAVSEQNSAEAQQNTYAQLEQVVGALDENSISTSMTTFFDSVAQILNQPEDVSARNQAVLDGQTLAQGINTLAKNVSQMRFDVNEQVSGMANQINGLVSQIADLNIQITQVEAGFSNRSEAVGLRDRRQIALENLAKLTDIRVKEQDTGSVTVYVGSQFLVNDGIVNPVDVSLSSDRGMLVAGIHFTGTDAPLETTAGQLYGLTKARDQALGGFLDRLNDFAGTLAFEFNKVFASGQGLRGYDSATSQASVVATDKPLDQAGLPFTPVNGSFQVLVYDTKAKTTQTVDVPVHLLGDVDDTTLQSLADAINQIAPLSAAATTGGKLSISSLSATHQFAFANDTSGVLAALGINTFFTGSTAFDLGINQQIISDPAKFAASSGGIGVDTENAVKLAKFPDQAIASHNDESITTLYDRAVAQVSQDSAAAGVAAEATGTFQETLRARELSISGVNIDEEAVEMLTIQKSFQASARFVTTVKEMLDTLINL